jgi:hypothetical protein
MTDEDNDDGDELPPQGAPKASPPADTGRLKNGRFKKGFTGNANGRPKKSERAWSHRQLATDIVLEANAEVPVTKDGKVEFIPMHRLIMRRLFIQAAKGDLQAQKMALEYISRAQSYREAKDWKLHQELEQIEMMFEKDSEMFSERAARRGRNKWRKKSRKT